MERGIPGEFPEEIDIEEQNENKEKEGLREKRKAMRAKYIGEAKERMSSLSKENENLSEKVSVIEGRIDYLESELASINDNLACDIENVKEESKASITEENKKLLKMMKSNNNKFNALEEELGVSDDPQYSSRGVDIEEDDSQTSPVKSEKKQKSKGLLGKLLDVNERLDNVEDSVSTIDELKKLVETIRNEMSEIKKETKEDTVKGY